MLTTNVNDITSIFVWDLGLSMQSYGKSLSRLIVLISILSVFTTSAIADTLSQNDNRIISNPTISLSQSEKEWLKENQTIHIAGPRFFPPFHFYDQQGELHGISAEYIFEMLDQLGVKIEIHRNLPWTEVLGKASTGEIDLIPCIAKTSEREMFLNFSEPYLSFPLVIITKKADSFVGGIEDLFGRKLSLVQKTMTEEWLKRDGVNFEAYFVKSPLKGLEAVSFGKADAQIENLATASYLIQKNGLSNLKVSAPTPYVNYNLYMATRKDIPELLSIVNKAIQAIPSEKQREIRNKWLSVRYEHGVKVKTIVAWVLAVLSVAAGILIVFFLWNRKLQAEIQVRKNVERALKESEDRLIAAGKSSYDLIYEWDIKKHTVVWFGNVEEFLGYKEGEITNDVNDWIALIHPDDVESFLEAMEFHSKSTQLINDEYRLLHKDQTYRYVYVNGRPLLDDSGEPYKWMGVCADITLRKQAELKLSKAAQEWQKTFDAMSSSVWVLDKNQRIIRSNKGSSEIFGRPLDFFIGKSCREIVCGKKGPEHNCISIMAKQSLNRECSEKKIGERWFEVTIDPILSVEGNYEGALQVITDITERKQTEKEKKQLEGHLQQAQKMEAIGNLAGGIAHDFNNMLGVIMGNISYSLSQVNGDKDLFKTLSDAQEGAKQAQQLTHQLLTFSKGGEPIKKITNVNKLLEESATLMSRGSKSICEFDLSDDLWPAEVDTGQLNQVFNNLCINAIQAMPDGGILHVTTKNLKLKDGGSIPLQAGSYILIRLSDTGTGIPEKFLVKIFDPFFTTKNTGTGLGLATTFSIIKRHGGHISVSSVVGEKTAFDIYLPADRVNVVEVDDKKESTHIGSGKILIMDDQEPILEIAERMLKFAGYETVTVTDGSQAVALYKEAMENEKPYDLVILDLTVPGGMGGADTMPKLLALDENVKAVVSSGYSNDPIMARYQDYGFCGIIPKPYTLSDLSALLNMVFD